MAGPGEEGVQPGSSAFDRLLADLRRLAEEDAPIEEALRTVMPLTGLRRGPLLAAAEFFDAARDLPEDQNAVDALRLTRRLLAVPVFRC